MKETEMLDQLGDLLLHCERAGNDRMPTMRSFLMVLRVVYYLLRCHINEKKCG